MKALLVPCLLAGLFLAGCTPVKLTRLQAPEESQRSEVLVFRESSFNAGGIGMVFGSDGNDYVSLSNDQYAQLQFRPGSYNFFVRSTQGDKPFVLPMALGARESRCLKAYANPANLGKAVLPVAYLLGNTFLLEQVNCPTKEELAKYGAVAVEYGP